MNPQATTFELKNINLRLTPSMVVDIIDSMRAFATDLDEYVPEEGIKVRQSLEDIIAQLSHQGIAVEED